MIASYLTKLFGPDSVLPKSPADMPEYKDTVRPFSSDAMNIEYVEYDMPGPSMMPFSAAPGKDGYLWIPDFRRGQQNHPARSQDRRQPRVSRFRTSVPRRSTRRSRRPTARCGSPSRAPTSSACGTRKTKTMTEYQDRKIPGEMGYAAGSKHTLRFDGDGNVWFSGTPLGKFDPKTKEYYDIPGSQARLRREGRQGRQHLVHQDRHRSVRHGRLQDPEGVHLFAAHRRTPSRAASRSIRRAASSGPANSAAEKCCASIPRPKDVKEFVLPGPQPTPYGMGIDANGDIWYASYNMDVLGRFDPKTGKITEYPFPAFGEHDSGILPR